MKSFSYETLSEALKDLKLRGYILDFNIRGNCIECNDVKLNPDEFKVEEFYRFEGMTNPDDEEVVYAIVSNTGLKGTLVDAYGAYSDQITGELIKKLKSAERNI
ncbi:MAG: phosphoribosylpyrophosphate synthetase [Ignavibacteria bacterium]|nr:phosphoribosylpyrophosphate synthetase [Ignavibacteria bacterium]